ncbi:MAG: pyruvate ferredoxin oxidoreductase [Thermoplasmata archaeon]|nr:MAG: pyruvate ferredoxin oxidoreductase [Thermoplasmata archaeon]
MIEKIPAKKMVITGDYAAAYGALLCDVDVVAAYPITPQTLIVEEFSNFVNDGITDAEFIMVESEHSAMSACIAAQAAGARTFTATASQGLALMHEMLFIASALRLPIVMPVVNRTVAAPIGIWCEHNDSMPQRDTGWIQMSCEDNQEVLDMVIMAYKIGEHKDVLLPVMPCLDAFILSHTVEPVNAPSSDEVADFIGKYEPHAVLDPDNPMAIGTFTPPEYIQELRYQTHVAMENAKNVIKKVTKEFASKFGREYHGLIEEYRCDDAEVILITVGTVTGTAREVVDDLRQKGKKVGLIKLRFYRPFPAEEIRKIAENVKAIGVYDRAISYGSGGPLFIETRHALYGLDLPVLNFLAGLGGRDVMTKDVEKMYEILLKAKEEKPAKEIYWIGTRGVSI